jgi:hypothetical protein
LLYSGQAVAVDPENRPEFTVIRFSAGRSMTTSRGIEKGSYRSAPFVAEWLVTGTLPPDVALLANGRIGRVV